MRKQSLVARAIHANRRALAALALALFAVPALAAPSFSVGDVRCAEGSTCSVTITKNAPASSYSKIRVWTPGHGTATIGVDYPAFDVTIVVANSALVVRIPFTAKADALVEGDEVAGVQIASVRNAIISRAIGIVTIADKTASAPPPPATQTCPDGSVIPATSTCPVPLPPPAANDAPLASPTGALEIRSPIEAAWADAQSVLTGQAIPASATPDVVGAFRFICGAGGVNYDDMLVFPGQPGKSHLHQYYGQTSNAYSTYESLRAGTFSTCAYGLFPGNLSSYWMPAMLDGQGGVVQPDVVRVYYKRLPKDSPGCGDPTDVANKREGICTGIPTRFKMIAGSDMKGGWTLNQRHDDGRQMSFLCEGVTGKMETLTEALNACPVGGALTVDVNFPQCFDGRVDSPDHRSHVAYPSYGTWGYARCPFTHPFLMPQLHVAPQYRVTAALKATGRLSCDPSRTMNCIHFDYAENWTERLRKAWEINCIDGFKNASGGDLCDTRKLIGAAQPLYLINGVWTRSWVNPNPVIPVPPMPAM